MHIRAYLFCLLSLGGTTYLQAQAETPDTTKHQLAVSVYVDAYYARYSGDTQEPFATYITSGARDNTIGLNIAQFSLHYEHERLRGNFTLHAGDIPLAIWSDAFPYVQEANVGVRLGEKWWFDAGFFRTHLGTESFLPKNNLLGSTAFATYNEPFYQSGARLSYDPAPEWHLEAWLLNGYNSLVDNNRAKSVGLLVNYAPCEATSLTYTNLYGNEAPDNALRDQYRFYQNASWQQQWSEHVTTILGADLGLQTNSDLEDPEKTAALYTLLLTIRYQIDERWSITTRGELFEDENGFISGRVPTTDGEPAGAELTAITLGGEYRPSKYAHLRAEGRYTGHPNELALFRDGREVTGSRWELLLTFGIDLDRAFDF